MHADDLFTAPQVAKICSTDLKTIHNWVNRGEIKYFRTPGRHLRFRRQDILEFLSKFGYPVPEGFGAMRPRVVVIDTCDSSLQNLKRSLAKDVDLEAFNDQVDALLAIGKKTPSLVLVNGSCEPSMIPLVEKLSRNTEKVPVAVYGGDNEVEHKTREIGAASWTADTDGKMLRRWVGGILGMDQLA